MHRVRALLAPVLEQLGYRLYDLRQSGPQGNTLQIFIDHPQGVGLDDCVKVSDAVGPMLDQADLIPSAYTLEVSSPGIDRALTSAADFGREIDHVVRVSYREGTADTVLKGVLVQVESEAIVIRSKQGEQRISLADIIKANPDVPF